MQLLQSRQSGSREHCVLCVSRGCRAGSAAVPATPHACHSTAALLAQHEVYPQGPHLVALLHRTASRTAWASTAWASPRRTYAAFVILRKPYQIRTLAQQGVPAGQVPAGRPGPEAHQAPARTPGCCTGGAGGGDIRGRGHLLLPGPVPMVCLEGSTNIKNSSCRSDISMLQRLVQRLLVHCLSSTWWVASQLSNGCRWMRARCLDWLQGFTPIQGCCCCDNSGDHSATMCRV